MRGARVGGNEWRKRKAGRGLGGAIGREKSRYLDIRFVPGINTRKPDGLPPPPLLYTERAARKCKVVLYPKGHPEPGSPGLDKMALFCPWPVATWARRQTCCYFKEILAATLSFSGSQTGMTTSFDVVCVAQLPHRKPKR